MQKDQNITTEHTEEIGRTFKVDRDPYGDEILYTKKTVSFVPGITVLTGCNGSGKSTLMKLLQYQMDEDNTPYFELDNLKRGGTNAMSKSIFSGESSFAASLFTSSEGERIVQVIGNAATRLRSFFDSGLDKEKSSYLGDSLNATIHGRDYERDFAEDLKNNAHKSERWLFFDACDSGLSIDNVLELKDFFGFLIESHPDLDVYIVVAANEYEMASDEKCLNVSTMKYEKYGLYEDYRKAILKSREKKNKRYQKVEEKKNALAGSKKKTEGEKKNAD